MITFYKNKFIFCSYRYTSVYFYFIMVSISKIMKKNHHD